MSTRTLPAPIIGLLGENSLMLMHGESDQAGVEAEELSGGVVAERSIAMRGARIPNKIHLGLAPMLWTWCAELGC